MFYDKETNTYKLDIKYVTEKDLNLFPLIEFHQGKDLLFPFFKNEENGVIKEYTKD